MALDTVRLNRLAYWITEREKIRRARAAGKTAPWTDDPILRDTRFCNVRRMDDKVSIWLLENWYPHNTAKVTPAEILAAAGLARLINWPTALDGLRAPRAGVFTTWDIEKARAHFEDMKSKKQKVFTGAYIINAAGGGNKVDIVLRQVDIFYRNPKLLKPDSMEATHAQLQRVPGIGSFIAGQMVADLRHVWPGEWEDRDSWAPIGPGSRRGMAWLEGWDGEAKLPAMRQEAFLDNLHTILAWARVINRDTKAVIAERKLEAHDIQNCLCEFDKFMRLTHGTGRAKNQFNGRGA